MKAYITFTCKKRIKLKKWKHPLCSQNYYITYDYEDIMKIDGLLNENEAAYMINSWVKQAVSIFITDHRWKWFW